MALVKIKVYAGKNFDEDITEGKGIEVLWNDIKDIVDMGLRVEVMSKEV